MDAKDLRTETTISERSSNGSSKFAQVGAAPPCSVSKTYENISANPLAKLEAPTSRPCAVIGPDRIIPPSTGDAYSKKGHYEPWLHVDNTYRQPPEYPHKIQSYQSPIRNISPRQTFQENMQRIMVQPSYNSVKLNNDPNYTLDKNAPKSSKITGPHEAKYCEVPYSVNPISSDQKSNEMCVNNMNSTRNYPQVWHPGGIGIRPTRPYGAPDLYQFSEYTSCAGPRPMPMPRPHRTMNEDSSHAYNETYYPEGNIRFKPYPTVKDRYPQARYEYVSNYANPFHPPPFPSHKYDLQKPLPPHVTYPQIPIKYLENRMTDTIMDGYQRPQPVNYNVPYRNQVIHPTYGPMIGSNLQNKVYPYPLDGPVKSLASNKLPYDSKLYTEYENARNKGYPMSDNVYHMKNQPILPNYPNANMQPTHAHPYYRKESLAMRNYEYLSQLRHLDPSMNHNALTRLSTQFPPNSIAISPSDSNTSNETSHTHGGSLEDCGYVSQSSTTSIRSFDSGVNRIMMPNEFYQRYNYPYQTMVRTSPLSSKLDRNSAAISSKDTKSIDVRQFLQTWNEGEEENGGKEKDVVNQSDFNSTKLAHQYGAMKNHEQLYVLGLVNVPSEELGKYEHIQKISKLPENIKGYNNIELLKHFEEAIESSNINNANHKQPTSRNYHSSMKSSSIQGTGLLPPRPISPLDVEAKISQSVIHKEVGCNFEIKPCSPEMLNAEVATTAQTILGEERVIEKVSNPIMIKSPILSSTSESEKMCDAMNQKEHRIMLKEDVNKTPSCKMIHTQCLSNEGVNVAKSNYSLQDLESNAGVCLASLPRLDNDIELTFPEVNQQFINANKESVIIANDYTTELEPMQDGDHYKTDQNTILKSENTSVMPILDLEKEVSKLSKYRKIKRNEVDFNENQFLSISQSLRTDSVIIKNPENTKSLEKKSRTPPLVKEMNPTVNHNVINSDPICDSPVSNQTTDNINMDYDSNEMAIDFSLSRVEDKHSKYFCEMYSTRNLNSPPAKLPNDQQFLEDTNTARNLPSDSTNDITMKIGISDEVNDINIKKLNKLDFEKLDITEVNDVQHLNVVKEQEDRVVVECLENLSEVNKESKICDIVIVSKADLLTEKAKDVVTKKSIKPTKEEEKRDTSSIDINTKVEDFLSCSLSGVYKVPKNDNDTNTNIQDIGNAHSSNDFYNNLDLKNNIPSFKLTAVKLDCTNDLQKALSYNNTIKSVVADKSELCKLVVSNWKIGSFVKQFSVNKELFSPQIQNLILSSEGHHSGLITSLQYENKSSSVIESMKDVSIENHLNTCNISQIQLNFANVKDHRLFDSEVDVLEIDNFSTIELQSVSTNVKDAAVNTVDNRVNDCTNNELQSEPTNVKDYVDSELDAKATAVDNSVEDSANNELKSESTNVKDFSNSDFDAEFPTVDNSLKDCTNNELQSEYTNVKNYADSDFDAVGTAVDNSVKLCTNNKLQLESTNVKDYADSDLDPEVTSVNNCVKDCTNYKLQSEPTNLTDYIDAEVTAVENSVKDCTKDKLQSRATIGKDYANSDLDAEICSVDNSFQDFTNDISRSESDALDTTLYNSVEDFVNKRLQTESANVQDSPDSGSDAHATTIDKTFKDGINDDELQSDFTNDCPISDADADIFKADNLNNVTSFTNVELQPEHTNLKESPVSDLDAEVSYVDDPNSVKNFASSKVQSDPDPNNFKHSSVFDSDVNAAEDNLRGVDEFTKSEFQLVSTDVKDCPILGSTVDISDVDRLNGVNVGVNSKLQSESIIVKDCKMSASNVKLSVVESLNIVKDCANSELQSKTTDFDNCPISDSDSNVNTSAVDNLNGEKGCAQSEIEIESTNVNDCTISELDVDTSSVDSVKDFRYSGLSTNHKDCQTSDSIVDISGVDSLYKDCANNNLQSESNVNDSPIPDTYVEHSFMDNNSVKDLAIYSKSFNYKESISQIAKYKIESGSIDKETFSTNDVSLDDNVAHLNKNSNPDIKDTEIFHDAFTKGNLIAKESGAHYIEKESNVCDEQVTETNNFILHDSNICREQTSERKLNQITTTNEDTEIMMTSNTKESLVRSSLKRSLSDSALFFHDKSENFLHEGIQLHTLITKRRRKNNEFINSCQPHFSANEMLNIHNNRRNSISSIYNEENMSFCIVIDNNCIITEENEDGEKICYTEIPEECLTGIHTGNIDEDDVEPAPEIFLCSQENTNEYNEPLVLEISDEKSLEETWVDDVAYVETVVSDDIAEDIELSAPSSPTEIGEQDNDESGIFTSVSEHTEKVKYIYGDKMCIDDAELVETLYRTPQMNVNKTLINRDSLVTDDDDDECYKENPINNASPELRGQKTLVQTFDDCNTSVSKRSNYNNTSNDATEIEPICFSESEYKILTAEDSKIETTSLKVSQDNTINSCESSVDDVFAYNHDEYSTNCSVFSSPEVSSTTSEEKNTSLLLKITNYQGTRTSQLNDLNMTKTNSCKFTENSNYTNFISNSTEPRPLITKAAQKYIPPLKEPVDNLKVKLPLPQDSLLKFKQLKMAKTGVRQNAVPKKDIPKKPKPKFEDVLKSLDDIQYKMHREKRKKNKKPVPKVVIKKTENGSHYASTANRDCFNPDLTGRKWQPWVFIEKSSFIDKMALRRKTKAIFNHRKNTYVFADKFKKYKSMPNAKFVITQPKLEDTSVGKLKYTIRLKHSY